MTGYVIRGGAAGRARLGVIARTLRSSTLALLKRAGLVKGMMCLDLGCGGGDVTLEMARLAGPHGRALGIDVDEVKLDAGPGRGNGARDNRTLNSPPATYAPGRRMRFTMWCTHAFCSRTCRIRRLCSAAWCGARKPVVSWWSRTSITPGSSLILAVRRLNATLRSTARLSAEVVGTRRSGSG